MLSYSDFDMKDIGRKKTAVFLIVQDEKKTLHPLATIFIKQCYETLIDVAQENKGHLPYRTNFILDEFANMPPLKDVTTMVTAARSRHIRFTFIIQNYAQLTQVYGKEQADTIKGNCNIMYLITSELQALEEISKMCGEVKSKEKDKTASQPLVTVSDLQRLKMYEAIIMRLRLMPYKTKLTPDYKMDWGKTYEKAGYPSREKRPVELWDIREFVKNMKKEKMEKMMAETGISAPPSSSGSIFDNFIPPTMTSNIPSSPLDFSDTPSSPSTPSFNVDDLVKRIDAKIAELEEEERREKLEQEKTEQIIPEEPITISSPSRVEPAIAIPSAPEPQTNPITMEQPIKDKLDKQPLEDITKPEISKSDDAFFDDFFSDE